jgi:hypothetical protein
LSIPHELIGVYPDERFYFGCNIIKTDVLTQKNTKKLNLPLKMMLFEN